MSLGLRPIARQRSGYMKWREFPRRRSPGALVHENRILTVIPMTGGTSSERGGIGDPDARTVAWQAADPPVQEPMQYKFNEPRRHKIPTAKYGVTNWPDYDAALVRRVH